MGDEAVKHQIGEGRDIMSILSEFFSLSFNVAPSQSAVVKANVEASDEDKLPDDELLGQMS